MPFPPNPTTYECPKCGWKKTTIPDSDELIRGWDIFESCPNCGHQPLNVRTPTTGELSHARIQKQKMEQARIEELTSRLK